MVNYKCLELNNNFIEISNNKYIFGYVNNNSIINYSNNEPLGICVTTVSGTPYKYLFSNIPKNNALTFYRKDNTSTNTYNYDLYNQNSIISFGYNKSEPIKIYVSRGTHNSDGFINEDYFRFYDESYNLINLNFDITDAFNNDLSTSYLYDNSSNFYFMKGVSYEFIATTDYTYDSSYIFEISSNTSTSLTSANYKLLNSDSSFILYIEKHYTYSLIIELISLLLY